MALTFDKIKDLTGSTGLMGVDLLGSARIRDSATIGTNMTIGGILKAGNILDDDTFATATSTTLATAESIKAYVDAFPSTISLGDLEDVNSQVSAGGDEQDIIVLDEYSGLWVRMPKDIFLDEITSNLLTIETTLTVPTSATISIADAPVSSTHATNKAYVDTMLPLSGGAVTGAIIANSTFDGVDIATRDVVLTSTTTTANAALPKTGGAMTGAITTNSTFDSVDIATRDGVLTSTTTTANAALPKAGGAMTGAITTNSTFDGVDIGTRDALLSSTIIDLTATTVTANAALPKTGGTMTGAIILPIATSLPGSPSEGMFILLQAGSGRSIVYSIAAYMNGGWRTEILS